MKVFELLETDEWTNQENTLDDLFRTQAARCQEYMTYQELIRKENGLPGLHDWSRWLDSLVKSRVANLPNQDRLPPELTLTPEQKVKWHTKYERMLKAKQAYEKAGGNYK